jgi:UDP-N-acetylmuramate dehydrogenase
MSIMNAFMTDLDTLRTSLGERLGQHLQENVMLSNYTTARIGGPADALLPVNTLEELIHAVEILWRLAPQGVQGVPFTMLGSGSNILVSDKGVRGVVILNHAHTVKIDTHHTTPAIWAESGANLGTVARQAALRGLATMEWAATIPGTVGGAVYGNAGAHDGDTQANLVLADILHHDRGREVWTVEQMAYQYRSSILKREHIPAVILAAQFKLRNGSSSEIQKKMDEFSANRRRTQPPGATMGSMFKNPPGDFAGRLIDAAGLKGKRIGDAGISPIHANFFINHGQARAQEIYALIRLVQREVAKQFSIQLELEVELIGEFKNGA